MKKTFVLQRSFPSALIILWNSENFALYLFAWVFLVRKLLKTVNCKPEHVLLANCSGFAFSFFSSRLYQLISEKTFSKLKLNWIDLASKSKKRWKFKIT